MKNRSVKERTISLAFCALVSLLGACATGVSPQAENRTAAQRNATGAVVTQGYAGNGSDFTVREVHGLPPIGL